MSSRQSTEQARRNGALAAGTKSPEGIKRLSMNALRHGLTAKSLVLATESQEQFDELLKNYVEFYDPNNTVELDLVHDMVAARWRLQRSRSVETVTLNQRMVDREAEKLKREPVFPRSTRLAYAVSYLANCGKSLDILLRYETTYSRAFDRAQKALEKMQKTRPQLTTSEELRNEPRTAPAVPTAPTELEAATPTNENCETTPSPQPLRRIGVISGLNRVLKT